MSAVARSLRQLIFATAGFCFAPSHPISNVAAGPWPISAHT